MTKTKYDPVAKKHVEFKEPRSSKVAAFLIQNAARRAGAFSLPFSRGDGPKRKRRLFRSGVFAWGSTVRLQHEEIANPRPADPTHDPGDAADLSNHGVTEFCGSFPSSLISIAETKKKSTHS